MEKQIIDWLLANGWHHSHVFLYDEEGVEGVRWEHLTDMNAKEYYEISDWNSDPVIPEELEKLLDPYISHSGLFGV